MHLRDGLSEPGNVSSKHELGQIFDRLRGDGKSCEGRGGGGLEDGMGRLLDRVAVCRETSLLRENGICSQEGGGVAANAAVIGHAVAFSSSTMPRLAQTMSCSARVQEDPASSAVMSPRPWPSVSGESGVLGEASWASRASRFWWLEPQPTGTSPGTYLYAYLLDCVAYCLDRRTTSLLFRPLSLSLRARVEILPMGSPLEWGVWFDREPSNSQHL